MGEAGEERPGSTTPAAAVRSRAVRWLTLAIAGMGLLSRIAPLFDRGGRVFWQFPSEDGYLMLTIARNMALGHGMSTAGGSLPTNGTQPLATGLWALCFWLVDGDRFWGVFLVQLVELAIACACALLMLRLARRAYASRPWADTFAPLAVALWFASPVVVRHSMNCLESGLYVLIVLAVLLAMLGRGDSLDPGRRLYDWAGLGVLLGIAFWARNDAVLLCLVVGGAHLLGLLPAPGPLRQRVLEVGLAAALVTLISLPWLANNLLGFGSLLPISGQAESRHAVFAGNLHLVPIKLSEYLSLLAPIPNALEASGAVSIVTSVLLLGIAGVLIGRSRSWVPTERLLLGVGGAYTLALGSFYGLYFGAGHFMSRYLFPASPLLTLLSVAALAVALHGLRPRFAWATPALASGIALALVVGLNLRLYVQGTDHAHRQVIEWVQANAEADEWVGAIQTGTVGFFHDRTLNLDGKVNPEALEARKQRRFDEYVAESPIRYLADWHDLSGWAELPIGAPFELIVSDRERNLAVLRRRAGS